MKIYTKTGDDGTTALYRGGRVPKGSQRIIAYGTVDELNSVIGYLRSFPLVPDVDQVLFDVQNNLFTIGADLATPVTAVVAGDASVLRLAQGTEQPLELAIDSMEAELPPLKHFILPAGVPAASTAHMARTVCRRAEREVVKLEGDEEINHEILVYLNRLSDYLFVLARYLNHLAGHQDAIWARKGGKHS